MPCRAAFRCFLLALCVSSAGAAEIQIREDYTWPGEAGFRWSLRQDDLLIVSRSDLRGSAAEGTPAPRSLTEEGPVLGVSLPWLRCGPLLARGMLRQVADPLGSSAWGSAVREQTTLALDGELTSSRPGVLIMPLPESCGLFCLPVRTGGYAYGALGRLPLGAGAAAEGVFLVSRPSPQSASDDWFLTRSPFPGGDVTDLCARLVLDSPSLGFSLTTGASSAQWASPGAFANLWISGRAPGLQAAVLVAGASPGYRAPDGACPSGSSRLSAVVRLGDDRRTGALEAGWSFSIGQPSFTPRPEVSTRTSVRTQISRDFERRSFPPLSLVVYGEKDISREEDGSRGEASRCGSTFRASLGGIDVTAGFGLDARAGVGVRGALSLRPSSRLRILAQAGANRLDTPSADASTSLAVSFESECQRAAIQAGFEDVPLRGKNAFLPQCFRLSMTCCIRRPQTGTRGLSPSLRPG